MDRLTIQTPTSEDETLEWFRKGLAARGITELTDNQINVLLCGIDDIAKQFKEAEQALRRKGNENI